jgi:outer membrane lipoprotein SlyB
MEQGRTHPIFIAAGAAVLLFSLLGAAALTGILPIGNTKPAEPGVIAQSAVAPGGAAPAQPEAPPRRATSAQAGTAAPAKPAPKRGIFSAPCPNCGVIDAIQPVEVKGKTSGLGAVAGGVAGGLLGNQIGSGGTRTVLTVGGAAGGAFAGDAIEGHMKKHTSWQVTVRLEDGSVRTLSQSTQPPFAVGDRVRIVNGTSLERA